MSCPLIRWMEAESFAAALPRPGAGHRERAMPPGSDKALAMAAIVAGLVLMNVWLLMAGFFILIGAQLEDQGVLFQNVVDTVQMRDVMLTEFSMLSPSDTLEDALYKSIHSLQDDFPVVRGDSLVGIISRPEHPRGAAQRRQRLRAVGHVAELPCGAAAGLAGHHHQPLRRPRTSLVPVTEGERIVGIVTLQNLMHSMNLLAESRKLQRQSQE